jgi:hypothetical protein
MLFFEVFFCQCKFEIQHCNGSYTPINDYDSNILMLKNYILYGIRKKRVTGGIDVSIRVCFQSGYVH